MLILGWISEGIIGAGLWIVSGIYHVAAFVFELFLILASGQLLEADDYETIITNFYIILGIIMLFVLAFSLLKGMVNPDDQKQGTSVVKKVIVNIITSSIIMAVLPSIFAFAYDFQDAVIMEQNTIGKFFGYGSATGTNTPTEQSNLQKVQQGAYQIVNGVFTAFFNINGDYCSEEVVTAGALSKKDQIVYCQENTIGDDGESYDTISSYVDRTGSFGSYGGFAENVDDNEIDFNFLLSLIAGLLLIYVGVTYCFDMAIRLVKLVFFQLIAPIPIFFRIIPDGKLSGVFGTWTKKTMSCYLEVYVRIFIFYFVIYLCNQMIQAPFLSNDIYEYGWLLASLAKAFILMGLVTFMRQAPKLFSEITGIDSGNMSLGIRDKLAAGGAFAAGAIIGGGATALTRNAVNAGRNVKNKFEKGEDGKWHLKEGVRKRDIAAGIAGGFASTLAGGFSGTARSVKGGWNAKSAGDMKATASSGATKAVTARDKRAAYKASHGGTFGGVIKGHAMDTLQGVGEWVGVGVGDTTLGYYATAAQATNSFNDMSEGTYKKKQEYVDQSSIVKSLKSKVGLLKPEFEANQTRIEALLESKKGANARRAREIDAEIKDIQKRQSTISTEFARLEHEDAVLTQMQIDMAFKKRDVVALAATKLGVDQRVNYSDSAEFQNAYRSAVYGGFKIDFSTLVSETPRVERMEFKDAKTGQMREMDIRIYSYKDSKTGKIKEVLLDEYDQRTFDALLSGQAVDDDWVTTSNVVKIQDVIDQANIGRQHIKSVNERKHVVNTGNRPQEKKDK